MSIINKLTENKKLISYGAVLLIGLVLGYTTSNAVNADARSMYQANLLIQQAKTEKAQAEAKVAEADKTIEKATADLQGFLKGM